LVELARRENKIKKIRGGKGEKSGKKNEKSLFLLFFDEF
jgi:hypothetical protein